MQDAIAEEQKTGRSFYRRSGLCRKGRLGVHIETRSGRRALILVIPGFYGLLALGWFWGFGFHRWGSVIDFGFII